MALWEYKVITSGKGGFARPDLLEKFLNDLGRDEWEIVHFQTSPDNFLAFTGLARRSTQRDWTLEDAVAAAAKVEAEKLRAEFEAKFKAAASNAPAGAAEERAPSFLEEKAAPDDGFRKPVDTSHDDDPEAQEDEKSDDWDKLTAAEEDELPTFFEAIKPHMRRNQRGPGMSVGADYLAKKWDQTEDDLKAALVECGFVVPADEDAKAEHVEYDGDLYWLNINRRGELWINTKEKPRPVFRPVKAARVEVDAGGAKGEGQGVSESKPQETRDGGQGAGDRGQETGDRGQAAGDRRQETEGPAAASGETQNAKPEAARAGAGSLPQGAALLGKIRPHMRRNRRGPGGSGSTSFLSRALRTSEADLKTAFVGLGLAVPATASEKPVFVEIGNELWWLNVDSRGGLWINGRERKDGETAASAAVNEAQSESAANPPAPEGAAAVSEPEVASVVPTPETPAEVPTPEVATEVPPPEVAAAVPRPEVPAVDLTPEASSVVPTATEAAPAPAAFETQPVAPATEPVAATSDGVASPLTAVRLLLKETKTGSIASKVDRLAEELGKSQDELIATLVGAGLKVPEKPRERPVFVEHAGEILWLNTNAKGELWLNAKVSKFADKDGENDEGESSEEKPRRGRSPKQETE